VYTKLWSEKSDGKSPLGRQRLRWMDNIEIDLKQSGRVWS
jgi:hypothetical protein